MASWENREVHQCPWCCIWAYLVVGRERQRGKRYKRGC
jgi:hypothetical protein